MLGRMAIIAGALVVFLAAAAPAMGASQNLLQNQQYHMFGNNVIVHIVAVNVVDVPMSNIFPQPDAKYYQIVYQFENTGDKQDRGYIQPIFIDTDNGQYRYLDYTSQNVLPHSTTDPNFIEMPVPKNVVISKIIFIEGFNNHTLELQRPVASTTPATPSPTPTATATPAPGGNSWGDCLPLIPFAMAGGIAGVGIVINRCGLRKH
jgi:hypothetical protein